MNEPNLDDAPTLSDSTAYFASLEKYRRPQIEDAPELTDEDEKILDRVWKDIAKTKTKTKTKTAVKKNSRALTPTVTRASIAPPTLSIYGNTFTGDDQDALYHLAVNSVAKSPDLNHQAHPDLQYVANNADIFAVPHHTARTLHPNSSMRFIPPSQLSHAMEWSQKKGGRFFDHAMPKIDPSRRMSDQPGILDENDFNAHPSVYVSHYPATSGEPRVFGSDKTASPSPHNHVLYAYIHLERPAGPDDLAFHRKASLNDTAHSLQRAGFDGIHTGNKKIAFSSSQVYPYRQKKSAPHEDQPAKDQSSFITTNLKLEELTHSVKLWKSLAQSAPSHDELVKSIADQLVTDTSFVAFAQSRPRVEDAPELTADDEKILDKVWADIRKNSARKKTMRAESGQTDNQGKQGHWVTTHQGKKIFITDEHMTPNPSEIGRPGHFYVHRQSENSIYELPNDYPYKPQSSDKRLNSVAIYSHLAALKSQHGTLDNHKFYPVETAVHAIENKKAPLEPLHKTSASYYDKNPGNHYGFTGDVTVEPISPDVSQTATDFFGRDLNPREWAALASAPDGSQIFVKKLNLMGGESALKIESQSSDGESTREIRFDTNQGKPYIYNSFFALDSKGTGLGTRLFARQVDIAKSLGVAHLECLAAGKAIERTYPNYIPMNGYYTWARLGYDAPLPGKLIDEIQNKFGYVDTIQDLMQEPGGAKWWYDNGIDFEGKFYIGDNSVSEEVLQNYLAAKKIERALSPVITRSENDPDTAVSNKVAAILSHLGDVHDAQGQKVVDLARRAVYDFFKKNGATDVILYCALPRSSAPLTKTLLQRGYPILGLRAGRVTDLSTQSMVTFRSDPTALLIDKNSAVLVAKVPVSRILAIDAGDNPGFIVTGGQDDYFVIAHTHHWPQLHPFLGALALASKQDDLPNLDARQTTTRAEEPEEQTGAQGDRGHFIMHNGRPIFINSSGSHQEHKAAVTAYTSRNKVNQISKTPAKTMTEDDYMKMSPKELHFYNKDSNTLYKLPKHLLSTLPAKKGWSLVHPSQNDEKVASLNETGGKFWADYDHPDHVPQEVHDALASVEPPEPKLDPTSRVFALDPVSKEDSSHSVAYWDQQLDTTHDIENVVTTKDRIAKELVSRLKSNPDFKQMAYTAPFGKAHGIDIYDGSHEEQVAAALTKSWAHTSMDHDDLSTAMQLAAQREFGLANADMKRAPLGLTKDWLPHMAGLQSFLREMYNHTQDRFKALGVTDVLLHRGMYWDHTQHPKPPEWIGDLKQQGHRYKGWVVGEHQQRTQPMSSFATDPASSLEFAMNWTDPDMKDSVYTGLVLSARIPISRILGTCQTGYGCKNECEMVVMGGNDNYRVTSWRPGEVESAQDYTSAIENYSFGRSVKL